VSIPSAPAAVNDPLRRHLLRGAGATAATLALAVTGMLRPSRVLATEWRHRAFTARTFPDALKAYGASLSTNSREIEFSAPELAENGAQVVVEIVSHLPDTESIAIFSEKNRTPLAASLRFANGALPQVRIPLKLAESMRVRAVVRTGDGRYWHAQREIQVTIGGCAA